MPSAAIERTAARATGRAIKRTLAHATIAISAAAAMIANQPGRTGSTMLTGHQGGLSKRMTHASTNSAVRSRATIESAHHAAETTKPSMVNRRSTVKGWRRESQVPSSSATTIAITATIVSMVNDGGRGGIKGPAGASSSPSTRIARTLALGSTFKARVEIGTRTTNGPGPSRLTASAG